MLQRLLWVDCTAGALVGVAVLSLSTWLSELEGLPRDVLLFTGVANLLYAAYSFSLARRPARPMAGIVALVVANGAWAVVCMALATTFWDGATVLGRMHLVGEGLFVGGLAALEWTQRRRLLTAA